MYKRRINTKFLSLPHLSRKGTWSTNFKGIKGIEVGKKDACGRFPFFIPKYNTFLK